MMIIIIMNIAVHKHMHVEPKRNNSICIRRRSVCLIRIKSVGYIAIT